MAGTALIIAYYFPPIGMGGVQRMAKLAKYLPQFGYEVVVLTVKPIRYSAYDDTLLKEMPPQVQIVRSGSHDPARIARLLRLPLGRGHRAAQSAKQTGRLWPDSKAGWQGPALRTARRIMDGRQIDLVLSSSPPVTGHLVAMALQERYGLPWVADFRDLWESRTPEKLYDSPMLVAKAGRLLREIAVRANAVTCVNDSIGRRLKPEAITIAGGFDPDDFVGITTVAGGPEESGRFILCYMGTVGPLCPIEPFLEAAQIAALRDPSFDARVWFRIIGANDARMIRDMAARFNMGSRVEITGYLSHHEALRRAAGAAATLLSVCDGYPEIGTGKIFDYLALRVPTLAVAPMGSEAEKLLKAYRGGICTAPGRPEALAESMLSLFQAWSRGEHWVKRELSSLTRPESARAFAALFDRIINAKR